MHKARREARAVQWVVTRGSILLSFNGRVWVKFKIPWGVKVDAIKILHRPYPYASAGLWVNPPK